MERDLTINLLPKRKLFFANKRWLIYGLILAILFIVLLKFYWPTTDDAENLPNLVPPTPTFDSKQQWQQLTKFFNAIDKTLPKNACLTDINVNNNVIDFGGRVATQTQFNLFMTRFRRALQHSRVQIIKLQNNTPFIFTLRVALTKPPDDLITEKEVDATKFDELIHTANQSAAKNRVHITEISAEYGNLNWHADGDYSSLTDFIREFGTKSQTLLLKQLSLKPDKQQLVLFIQTQVITG